jgi:ubiquinol oxidase
MESLGGDQQWGVRFFAQHSAIVYFFVLIALWSLSPSLAYNFSELIENHAVDTYAEFAESNKELLMQMPPPYIACAYYESDDMYIFDEFQTSRERGSRRPKINNLYDVFCNIRDDEAEHVATMSACQDASVTLKSPKVETLFIASAVAAAAVAVSYIAATPELDINFLNNIIESAVSTTKESGGNAEEIIEGVTKNEIMQEVNVIPMIVEDIMKKYFPIIMKMF